MALETINRENSFANFVLPSKSNCLSSPVFFVILSPMIKNQELFSCDDVVVYTDGGCHGNPGIGAWAGVIIYGANEAQISGGEAHTTNNRMELTAAIKTLSAISQNADLRSCHVTLYSDSQYVKNGITSWIKNWKKNGWRTAAKKPVLNQDLWQKLDALSSLLDIEWKWVRGHAGHKYNEICDTLCQTEMKKLEK